MSQNFFAVFAVFAVYFFPKLNREDLEDRKEKYVWLIWLPSNQIVGWIGKKLRVRSEYPVKNVVANSLKSGRMSNIEPQKAGADFCGLNIAHISIAQGPSF